jgi:LacI family transcriptional regulator
MKTRNNGRVTILDVAKRADVAIKTVSRVLNNEANVKENTRARVLRAIKELNYAPSLAARGLAGTKSFLVGLLYDNPSPYYMNSVQVGALQRCRDAGFHLLVEFCDADTKGSAQRVHSLITQTRLDGVLLTPPVSDNTTVRNVLNRDGIAHVVISPPTLEHGVSSVHMDDRRAAFDMVEHLISLGHSKIGFIKGHPQHGAAKVRLNGYTDALRAHGIEYNPALVVQGLFSFESGYQSAQQLLTGSSRPTAIFAANDDMAAGAIAAAHELGISVPDKLSVCGFDDTPVATITWPALTTIRQPIVEMAAGAADLLLAQIRAGSKEPKTISSHSFRHDLIVRGSTAQPARR